MLVCDSNYVKKVAFLSFLGEKKTAMYQFLTSVDMHHLMVQISLVTIFEEVHKGICIND